VAEAQVEEEAEAAVAAATTLTLLAARMYKPVPCPLLPALGLLAEAKPPQLADSQAIIILRLRVPHIQCPAVCYVNCFEEMTLN
jgi:hypothetical protein